MLTTFICLILILFIIVRRRTRILIGTPIIDRDIDILSEFLQHIKPYIDKYNFKYTCDMMFMTRTSDTKTINLLTKLNHPHIILQQVQHYEINKRHNFEHLTKKRQFIINYAKQHNYDYVFFVDSDIMIQPDTVDLLLNATVTCCYCPISLHWSNEKLVGVASNELIDTKTLETNEKYIYNIVGGFGCTLIHKNAFSIPLRVTSMYGVLHNKKQLVTGEDIAFYIDCLNNNMTTACLLHHDIEHKCHRAINVCKVQ